MKSEVNHVVSYLKPVKLLNTFYFLSTVKTYGNGSLVLRSPGLRAPSRPFVLLTAAVIESFIHVVLPQQSSPWALLLLEEVSILFSLYYTLQRFSV